MFMRTKRPAKRRTTLTLPANLLREAEKVAREKQVNLSVVVAEALEKGLQARASAARGQRALELYRKAFHGLSDAELSILDGVIFNTEAARSE